MSSLRGWWGTFSYNYGWSDYVTYIDGWIPKLALSVPIIGYLILFNDKISELLVFKELANEETIKFGLSGIERLRLIYFGLIFLGVSNLVYLFKKPYQFKHGKNLVDYTRTALDLFTLSAYIQIESTIRHEGHLTVEVKGRDSVWKDFLLATNNTKVVDWEGTKSKYGDLLRNLLAENFFRYDRKRRCWLTLCLFLTTVGYVFMLAPSFDLFVKVCVSVFDGVV